MLEAKISCTESYVVDKMLELPSLRRATMPIVSSRAWSLDTRHFYWPGDSHHVRLINCTSSSGFTCQPQHNLIKKENSNIFAIFIITQNAWKNKAD